MSYKKIEVLKDNTRAIEIALSNKKVTEQDVELLKKYKGFGGIKAILLPLDKPELFNDVDKPLIEPIKELHQVLQDYSASPVEYEKYLLSIKNSVLTSFYTPNEVVASIGSVLSDIPFQNMLEPSAGIGVFLEHIPANNKTGIEKDLLTGRILAALHQDKNIMVQGFEKTQRKYESSFDLVISNIPFGTVPVFDPVFINGKNKARQASSRSVHNYFFLKGLDMLQEGGVLTYITSTGVMDSPGNEFLRKELLKEAHLISAVRLPHNLFLNTGGIEVGSDLIMLQKDTQRSKKLSPEEKLFISSDNSSINDYFQNLSHVIHSNSEVRTNQFSKEITVFYQEGGEITIAEKLKNILTSDISKNFSNELFTLHKEVSFEQIPSPQGQFSLFDDASFFAQQLDISFDAESNPSKAEYEKYIELKEIYFQLKDTERINQVENSTARELLNKRYDSFVKDHGYLLLNKNDLINKDSDYIELIGLEKNSEQHIEKADIFFEPVSIRRLRNNKISITDALNVSLNETNFVDLSYIGLLSGKTETEVKEELLSHKQIYYYPITDEYQISSTFISGNIIEKRDSLVSCLYDFREDPDRTKEIRSAIEALEKATPTPLSLDKIGVNFGERWIPEVYYKEFSKHILNPPGTPEADKHSLTVNYLSSTDDFIITTHTHSPFAKQKYTVRSYNRHYSYEDVFRFALLDIIPEMTIKKEVDGHEIKMPDTKGIQEMNAAIDDIRSSFNTWLNKIPDSHKDDLETIYNKRFRNSVKSNYDGSFQTFPDLDYEGLGIKELYPSQKDAILMLKLNGGGIIDHEVGGGKTLIQCVASYEMKRLGLVNKPAILGLKANIYDIAETYQKAYPTAKVFYPTKEELKTDNIENFLSKIQNNNWDVIILSHEQFAKIPQSIEIQEQIMTEELGKLEESLNTLRASSDKEMRQAYKQLEKRKENLVVKLNSLNYQIDQHKGCVIDFKTMGIDHLFIDESHKYKNLSFVTKHTRAAGLGTPSGSLRAQNMLYAIRTIQEKTGRDLGATFLSGTTISNSLTELYNIFNYLRPSALKEQGIFSFDAWLATYAVKSKEFEFSVTNEIIQKERFRSFCKAPELSMFYGMITDYKTAEDIGVDRPKKEEFLINIRQTPDQVDMYERLKTFAKTADGELIYRLPLTESEEKAKMLIATNTAMKASIDMRLIDPNLFGDHANNKINNCVEQLLKFYNEYDYVKGTQFVFCDIGTFNKNKEWDVYSEIKNKLVSAGVPNSEIQFIQDFKTDKKKRIFQKGMNEGSIRVGIGSTEMLGTGVNAQQRTVAIHHLDIPWTPKDFTQRNGRGVRAGNWVAKNHADNKVSVFIYAVEKTLDVYKFNLQATKHNFISQIKSQNINVRTIDEGGMDENSGMNFNDYIAILSGDRSLLEKAQLERKILQLKSEEKTFYDKIRNKDLVIESLNEKIIKNERIVSSLKEDIRKFQLIPRDAEGNVIFKIDIAVPTLNKEESKIFIQDNPLFKTYSNIKDAGIALNSLVETENKDTVNLLKVGEFYGFDINIRAQSSTNMNTEIFENKFFISSPGSNITYTHNNGAMPRTPELAGEYLIKALDKIDPLLKKHQSVSQELKDELTGISAVTDNVFPKKETIAALENRLKGLIRKIENKINNENDSDVSL